MKLINKSFNGKIYGKNGSYSIYVKNEKVDVTDEQVEEYKKDKAEYDEILKKHDSGVLRSIEVQNEAVKLGIEKAYVQLSFEQLKKKWKHL
jgi:ribosomal protein S9